MLLYWHIGSSVVSIPGKSSSLWSPAFLPCCTYGKTVMIKDESLAIQLSLSENDEDSELCIHKVV